MVRVSSKIRALLLDAGLVTVDEWEEARTQGPNILDTLISRAVLDEGQLLEVLGRSAGVPPIDLTRVTPDPAAIEAIPKETCVEWGLLPISKNGDVLTIAASDPFNVLVLDDLKRMTGCQIRTVFVYEGMVREAQESIYQTGRQQVDDLLEEVSGEASDIHVSEEVTEDLETAASGDDAPAVKMISVIMLRALKDKASDIHIEPCDHHINVRFRIDGRMSIAMQPPKSILNALISRLKILAQLDIAERQVPQDGKLQIRYEGRTIDLRLSVLPVVGGEKAVLRILDTGNMALKLATMGYEDKCHQDILDAINAAYGMLLVTGPTGSGKSTTLYSCVQEVATPEVNVVTVEDPVEYRMDGINQVPVNPKRGMTFSGALRSILRQDPDVVLVGEIRDLETADIAIKAALTGHLVLSTLHTNDAASTITRLVDMGIDPFMVSSSLLCVCAQRLGRRLCQLCRERVEDPPKASLLAIGFKEEDFQGMELYKASEAGCARCNKGYSGRFPILETLPITAGIKRLIVTGKPVDDIKKLAVEEGLLTLRRIGLLNAGRGVTSIEEILRITLED